MHALLRRGAVFTRDAAGSSVLHRAAANNDPAVVGLLLQAMARMWGANPRRIHI